jgi:hypothetical protein
MDEVGFMKDKLLFLRNDFTSKDHSKNKQVYLVSKVRLNGEKIKNSWARLPDVAIFKNWRQANSFAVRYEWEHPKGSGKWRYGYIQQHTSWSMVDKSVPGSITRFSKASGVLHWLLGETPTKVVPWVYRPVSSVRYLRVTYDLMPQSIRFSTGKPEVSLIPMARNSPSNVDLSSQKANLPPCNGGKHGICGGCQRYGLPRCSYTPNVPTQSDI